MQGFDNTALANIESASAYHDDGVSRDVSPRNGRISRERGGANMSRRPSATSVATGLTRAQSAQSGTATNLRRPGAVRSIGMTAGSAPSPTLDTQGPVARRQVELMAKYDKIETQRGGDAKDIQDRLKRMHEMREDRFNRLLDGLTMQTEVHYQTALALRERNERLDNQVRQLHAEMEEKIFDPMERQCGTYLNPPDRHAEIEQSGSKKVDFKIPGQTFRLSYNALQDPARRPLVEAAKENAFHVAAEQFLRKSQSAPGLHGLLKQGAPAPNRNGIVPQSLSRPSLEPENWHQVALQGTLFGHNAQVSEQGHGFKRARRGGSNVHVPDESDGVIPAGTRKSRTLGINDKGILHAARAAGGETTDYRTDVGHSSSAPAQDHYTFEVGQHAAALEFPLGKRLFPDFYVSVDPSKFN